MKTSCEPHIELHKRAQAILIAHGDTMQDQQRNNDLRYLNAMVRERIVWGSPKQKKWLDEIEAEFPISDIALAQLDSDVSGCIKSNRDIKA